MWNTSKLLFKVFSNEPIVEQFDKHRKFLKAVNSSEYRESYKDCIAQLKIKLICTEDKLKKNYRKWNYKIWKATNHSICSLITQQTIVKGAT